MAEREIAVGYDGSDEARRAVDWALDEGARTARPVALVYALQGAPVPVPAAPVASVALGWSDPGVHSAAWQTVDAAVKAAQLRRPDVTVSGSVQEGPAPVVLQERSRNAALLVLGARGVGGFVGLLLGSTGATVAAHAYCPVVVVRGPDRGPEETSGPVVVGVDDSDHARRALDFAFRQAAARGARLHAVNAWRLPSGAWHRPEFWSDELGRSAREGLDALVSGARAGYPNVPTSCEAASGPAAETLIQASRTAQLLVVGARGRGGFAGLLLGSVSHQVLHHACCPVAVVRREPAEEPGEPDGVISAHATD